MIYEEQLPMVAMPQMNDTHLEEVILINRIDAAIAARDAERVGALLEELLAHTVVHFETEEAMMREQRFPPYLMHKSEHDRALGEMRIHVGAWKEQGDFALLERYIGDALPQWIVQHVGTMDMVTANFLVNGVSPCGSGAC